MAQAFRIARAAYAGTPDQMLSGDGAKQFGGRWNRPGRSMVYASETRALAMLETIVRNRNPAAKFKIISLQIPDALILELGPADLPSGWDALSADPSQARDIGDAWFDQGSSAVLRIPSAIVPAEANYLLNTTHLDFLRIAHDRIQDFPFDPRLLR